jgi:hypothetical protein
LAGSQKITPSRGRVNLDRSLQIVHSVSQPIENLRFMLAEVQCWCKYGLWGWTVWMLVLWAFIRHRRSNHYQELLGVPRREVLGNDPFHWVIFRDDLSLDVSSKWDGMLTNTLSRRESGLSVSTACRRFVSH